MKVYTKTGDAGMTSLYDGTRASKHVVNFSVIGEIDELSSRIGMLCALMSTETGEEVLINEKIGLLRKIQRVLQDFNSYIATIDRSNRSLPPLDDSWVSDLEAEIDEMELYNPKLTKFIIPGVKQSDAQSHLCRTQARKVERCVLELSEWKEEIMVMKGKNNKEVSLDELVPEMMLKYMNRLSDFFFVFARWLCYQRGDEDCFV